MVLDTELKVLNLYYAYRVYFSWHFLLFFCYFCTSFCYAYTFLFNFILISFFCYKLSLLLLFLLFMDKLILRYTTLVRQDNWWWYIFFSFWNSSVIHFRFSFFFCVWFVFWCLFHLFIRHWSWYKLRSDRHSLCVYSFLG